MTIAEPLSERPGIEGGDEVEFMEVGDEKRLKLPTDEERLAEGVINTRRVIMATPRGNGPVLGRGKDEPQRRFFVEGVTLE